MRSLVRSSLLSPISVVFILSGKLSSRFISWPSRAVFTIGIPACPILVPPVNHREVRRQRCGG